MNDNSNVLKMKRESFRIEIRRKQMEDTFNQKRRHLLIIQPAPIEEEQIMIQDYQMSKTQTSGEFFINLLKQLDLDEATQLEIEEVLENVQYMLKNGRSIDYLQWAGPLDIVKAILDAMSKYKQNQMIRISRSTNVAENASKCFQQLIECSNKKVNKQVKPDHVETAMEIYKVWFVQSHPQLMNNVSELQLKREAIKGLDTIFKCTEGLKSFGASELMIDRALHTLHSKCSSEKLKMKIYKLLGSSSQYISNEEKLIKVLKIAQSLIESNQLKLIQKGLNIIQNASKNENHANFIMGMGMFKSIMDMIYQKDLLVQDSTIKILVNLSSVQDEDSSQQQLIELRVLDYIQALMKDCRRTSNRTSAALILSNLMHSASVSSQILEHSIISQSIYTMESDYLCVRRELFYAWTNLMEVVEDRQLLIKALDSGIMITVVKSLEEEDVYILISALKIIKVALMKIRGRNQMEEIMMKFLSSYNFESSLEQLSHHADKRIQKLVYQLMNNFYFDQFFL